MRDAQPLVDRVCAYRMTFAAINARSVAIDCAPILCWHHGCGAQPQNHGGDQHMSDVGIGEEIAGLRKKKGVTRPGLAATSLGPSWIDVGTCS
jgi:hypothetical protein